MHHSKIKRFLPFGLSHKRAKSGSHPGRQCGRLWPDWEGLLRIAAIAIVILGIVFRLGNLSTKPYWEDEVFTSTLVAGYEIESVESELKGRLISVGDLAKYQDVRLGRDWQQTSIALAKRPEHTPLYFLLARLWAECFGSSVAAMRAFPALSSLLTLPLFYWLARLLFHSSETATVTLCLACSSPILVRYAQDARPYSLWVVGMLLSSVLLLRAMQRNRIRHWIAYSVAVAFSGLTHWLSGFVFLAHGAYVLATKNISDRAEQIKRKRFFLALSIGLGSLVPWLGLVIYGRSSVQAVLSWLEQEETISSLVVKWVGNVSHLLFAQPPQGKSEWLFFLPFLVLIGWSTVQLVRQGRVRQWLLPILLCVIPTVAFVIPDLLFGGTRSLISRYFLSADIGALLILGVGLSSEGLGSEGLGSEGSSNSFKTPQPVWYKRILLCMVLTISLSACWFNLKADSWWGEANLGREAAIAAAQTASVVDVYSDQRLSPFLAFALSLRPTDRIMWLDAKVPLPNEMFDLSRAVLLFDPSDELLARVRQASLERGLQLSSVPNTLASGADEIDIQAQQIFQVQKQTFASNLSRLSG